MPPKERMNKIPYQRLGNHAPALNKAYVDQNTKSPPIIEMASTILANSETKSGPIHTSYYSSGSSQNNNLSSVLSSPVFAPINNMFTTVKYGVIGTVIIIIIMLSKKK